ncbi:GDP-mannose-dependent alpha-mannosyltransferase [Triticum urartu]|uniref:GDP-mannose-dependent alpha-mannosyltransferase n=1 Tax=Triticum urartu TaxID=4572 RepID=M8A690_TRIUA|nr:GDP-mannose-dependent alpha-mannosyltransferase [Triticum urartu]
MARAAPILAVSKPSPLPLIAPSSRPRAGWSLHLHRRRLLPLSSSSSCSTSASASSSPPSSPVLLRDDELEHQEEPPPASEADSRPRRIALFVEPSPFAYVSGYKNRFQNFIKYLREMGDEVIVITTHEGVPDEFHGAKLIGSWSFPCPWYQKVPLSLALSPRIIGEVARFKPDIIHASSPGIMVFGALIIAKLLCVPLVMSYHTHVPIFRGELILVYLWQLYSKSSQLIQSSHAIEFLHRAADLTLVPSVAIGRDLQAARVTAGSNIFLSWCMFPANKIRLWNKGVDSESFHPRFRNQEMRSRLTNGEPDKPLIIYVGRLGVEKSLDFHKRVMDRLPGSRIAFIGDGPFSGDVFVMPSESETLGFVVLEAMSSGVPVVAARAGGIPDIIPEDQEGKTSFLYTPGDVDDCVGKVELLLSCEELRETMGKAARKEMEKFGWKAATRKIRNEQYSAAIWFWRKKRSQLLRPLQWVFRRLFRPAPAPAPAPAITNQS